MDLAVFHCDFWYLTEDFVGKSDLASSGCCRPRPRVIEARTAPSALFHGAPFTGLAAACGHATRLRPMLPSRAFACGLSGQSGRHPAPTSSSLPIADRGTYLSRIASSPGLYPKKGQYGCRFCLRPSYSRSAPRDHPRPSGREPILPRRHGRRAGRTVLARPQYRSRRFGELPRRGDHARCEWSKGCIGRHGPGPAQYDGLSEIGSAASLRGSGGACSPAISLTASPGTQQRRVDSAEDFSCCSGRSDST